MKRSSLIAIGMAGLLALGAGTAVLVFPLSEGTPSLEEADATSVDLGEVRIGDRFQYTGRVSYHNTWWHIGLEGEWKGLLPGQGSDGRWNAVHSLDLSLELTDVEPGTTPRFESFGPLVDSHPLNWTTHYLAGGALLSETRPVLVSGSESSSSGDPLLPGNTSYEELDIIITYETRFSGHAMLCGLPEALGPRSLNASHHDPGGACADDAVAPSRVSWIDSGSSSLSAHLPDGSADVEYTAGNPYPVRVVETYKDGSIEWILTGYRAGSGAGQQAKLPLDPKVPAIELAPAGELGPETGGLLTSYPREQAWTDVMASPSGALVREFMESHASWRMAYQEEMRTANDPPLEFWSFILEADDADFAVNAIRVGPGPEVLAPAIAPGTIADPAVVVVANATGVPIATVSPPAEYPVVASVHKAWSAMAGDSGDTKPVWGHRLCDEESCLAVWKQRKGEMWVGNLTTQYLGTPGGSVSGFPVHVPNQRPGSPPVRTSALIVDHAGTVVGRYHTDSVHVRDHWLLPPVEAGGGKADPATARTPTLGFDGVGAAGMAVGAGLLAIPAIKLLATLFSRIEPDRLLDHPARARIVDLVGSRPGIHRAEVARVLGLGRGTVDRHLARLVVGGQVVARRTPKFTCYFPQGGPHAAPAAAALKSEGARRVLAVVAAHPGRAAHEVAQAAGLDASTVTHHVQRLQEAGLLSSTREGRSVRLVASPTGQAAAGNL